MKKPIPQIVPLEELESLGEGFSVLSAIFPAVAQKFNEDYQVADAAVAEMDKESGNVVDLARFRQRPQQRQPIKKLENINQLKEIFEVGRDMRSYREAIDIVTDYVYLCHLVNGELHNRGFHYIWVH